MSDTSSPESTLSTNGKDAMYNEFATAIRAGHHAKLKTFVKNGLDVNYSPQYELPPIAIAAELGKPKCIDALLKLNADINRPSYSGETALLRAARHGHSSCLKLLLDNGADIEACTKSGENVLYKVVDGSKNNMAESLRILFQYPIKDCLTTSGSSAVQRAEQRDMDDIVSMIKSHFENQSLLSLIKEEPEEVSTFSF